MIVITRHETESGTQIETYQNVAMVRLENQDDIMWLVLTFKTGSKEDLDLPKNNHELDIGWDIKEDTFEVVE